MNFYLKEGRIGFSFEKISMFNEISEGEAKIQCESNPDSIVYFLKKTNADKRVSYGITDEEMLFQDGDDISIIRKGTKVDQNVKIPQWIKNLIPEQRIQYLNIAHPNRKRFLQKPIGQKWRVNIVGLGDVGSNLLIGLKLLGSDCISEIGIYSTKENIVKRYEMELNQIHSIEETSPLNSSQPEIKILNKEDLMKCDMFIFCASAKVPRIGENVDDVRMIQYESNCEILKKYTNKARSEEFKGIFAIVSDPVDLLCKAAYTMSNQNEFGKNDYGGLMPEQIEGFGLGVMYSRALYYSKKDEIEGFKTNGRAFGPHGKGLIIANSIKDYDKKISEELTKKTVEANLMVRELGFKPYIAPALSSGAISIISRIKGENHYGSVYIDGAYFGIKNKYAKNGLNIERNDINDQLFEKIVQTHTMLKEID